MNVPRESLHISQSIRNYLERLASERSPVSGWTVRPTEGGDSVDIVDAAGEPVLLACADTAQAEQLLSFALSLEKEEEVKLRSSLPRRFR